MASVAFLLIVGVAGQTPAPATLPFKQIETGGFSRVRQERVFVIRSDKEYREYNKTTGRQVETPLLDWSKNQIIAVHIGSAPTTGYAVTVKRIVKTGPESAVVEVVELTPAPGRMQAMHVTYPYVLVSMPRGVDKVSMKVVGRKAAIAESPAADPAR